jgi:hypothetical protein
VNDGSSSISSEYDNESSIESCEDNFEVGVEINSSGNLDLSFQEKDPRIDAVVSSESSISVMNTRFFSRSSNRDRCSTRADLLFFHFRESRTDRYD